MNRPKLVANPVKPKLLSRQTTAALLGGVNIKTVDRLIQRGKLRGVKVGTRSMIDPNSIEAYLDSAG